MTGSTLKLSCFALLERLASRQPNLHHCCLRNHVALSLGTNKLVAVAATTAPAAPAAPAPAATVPLPLAEVLTASVAAAMPTE